MKPTLKILSSYPHRMMFAKSFCKHDLFILTALLLAVLHAAEP